MKEGQVAIMNASALHAIARHAYERIPPADDDFDAPIIAILFAAASMEAYIAEVAYHGEMLSGFSEATTRFADVMEDAEAAHVQVRGKYLLAKAMLGGKPFDKGGRPFQDFEWLIRIRNDIVHRKPDVIRDEPGKVIKFMRGRGLCRPVGDVQMGWLEEIATRAAARWACNTAVEMTDALFDMGGSPPPLPFLRNRLGPPVA